MAGPTRRTLPDDMEIDLSNDATGDSGPEDMDVDGGGTGGGPVAPSGSTQTGGEGDTTSTGAGGGCKGNADPKTSSGENAPTSDTGGEDIRPCGTGGPTQTGSAGATQTSPTGDTHPPRSPSSTQSTTSAGGPSVTLDPAPAGASVTTIPRTPFAGPWESHFTLNPPLEPENAKTLSHVNCSYLSTTGLPPSLTQLKKHAQSLAVLIKHLSVSTQEGLIDNANIDGAAAHAFHHNETWDWLNDLQTAYENDDHHHNIPLTSVVNRLEDYGGVDRYICPMHTAAEENPPHGLSLPYASHQGLIAHANEILELLDHEYSAKGGLLSILPGKDEVEDRKKAESTLLGQMILHMQRLTERHHNLEYLYANALDILKGEAAAPAQTLSKLGPKGRQGREIVYPQDRYVLANAGEDVWSFLQSEFNRKEYADLKVDQTYRDNGLSGEKLWTRSGGRDYARGITALDISTRYYRLRNDPLNTIFVIPAYETNPTVSVTREMEKNSTVVSVVKPVWPERASMWELRNREKIERLKQLEREHHILTQNKEELEEEKKLLLYDRELDRGKIRKLEADAALRQAEADGDKNKIKILQTPKLIEAAKAREEQMKKAREEAAREEEITRLKEKLARDSAHAQRLKESRELAAQLQQEKAAAENKRLLEKDLDLQRSAAETEGKLKAVWHKQLADCQELVDFLTIPGIRAVFNEVKIGQLSKDAAAKKAQDIIDNI